MNYFGIIFLVLSFFQIGTGLQCYSCYGSNVNIPIDPPYQGMQYSTSCVDPFQEQRIKIDTCPNDSYSCLKVGFESHGTKVVARGCVPDRTCNSANPIGADCSLCDSDLCNSSSYTVPSFLTVAFINFLLIRHYW